MPRSASIETRSGIVQPGFEFVKVTDNQLHFSLVKRVKRRDKWLTEVTRLSYCFDNPTDLNVSYQAIAKLLQMQNAHLVKVEVA